MHNKALYSCGSFSLLYCLRFQIYSMPKTKNAKKCVEKGCNLFVTKDSRFCKNHSVSSNALSTAPDAPPSLYSIPPRKTLFHPLTACFCKEVCDVLGIPFCKYLYEQSPRNVLLSLPDELFRVPPDGNCLFSSLCAAVSGSCSSAPQLRSFLCDVMPSVPGIEDHLILPSGRNFNSVQEYLQFTKMRQLGVFGTCLKIMVFSFISAVAVNVYSYVTSSWLLFSPPLNQTRVANIYIIHKHDHYEPIITVTNNSNSSGPSFVTLGSVCDSDDDLPLAKLRKFPEGELHNLVSEDDDLPLSSIIEQKTTDCNLSTSNREKCCRRVFEFDFASTIFRASKSKVETVFHEMQPFCPITTPSLSQHQVRKERRKQRNQRYRAKSHNQLRNLQQTKTRLLLSESNRLRNLCNVTTRLQDPIIRRNNLLRSKNRVLDPAKRLANLQRTKKRLLEPRARATNLNRARQRLLDPENC